MHPDWPSPHGPFVGSGKIKITADDFQVTEVVSHAFAGTGEHLYLWIEKRDINSQTVAQQLAGQVGVKMASVGFAGRKDRRAVTRQWFSVPINEQQAAELPEQFENFQILERQRHTSKLRSGDLDGNHFQIRINNIDAQQPEVDERLARIKEQGFANYFGLQRFGKGMQNLSRGNRMLAGKLRVRERHQRSLYLSACRSFLFNEVLAERVRLGNWHQVLDGDLTSPETPGPMLGLVGDGPSPASGEALAIEKGVLANHQQLVRGITNSRVDWHSRPAVMQVSDLEYDWQDNNLSVSFSLPKGVFATSLLSEIFDFKD